MMYNFRVKNDFLSTLFLYKPLRTVWTWVFSFLTMCMHQMRLDINWPAKHFTTNRTGSCFLMDTPEEKRKLKRRENFLTFCVLWRQWGWGIPSHRAHKSTRLIYRDSSYDCWNWWYPYKSCHKLHMYVYDIRAPFASVYIDSLLPVNRMSV